MRKKARHLWRTFWYFCQEAWLGLLRNGMMSVAAVLTGMVALLILGSSLLLQANLAYLADIVESQVEIVAYLRDGTDARERTSLLRRVERIPHVREVRFVSKEVALARLQESFKNRVVLRDLLDTNPLPDSLEITVHDPARIPEVVQEVRRVPGVEEVTYGRQVIDRLLALTRTVRFTSALGVALFAGVAMVIIVNTIHLTILARRQEIEIMKLVGATNWFIRWPFLLEGLLEGFLAAIPVIAFLSLAYIVGVYRLATVIPFLPLLEPPAILPRVALVLVTTGAGMGIGGSLISLHRFFHPKEPRARDPLGRPRRKPIHPLGRLRVR
ncbi:MAG: permease-like cell division protein FtsX [Armatimonadota bacterium]|nr:permease-like cell division protein FtsX [Armatimonadota bacterium]MDR7435532.1 permease-like cell division protein FtsX [Armatimonadota bacterium]